MPNNKRQKDFSFECFSWAFWPLFGSTAINFHEIRMGTLFKTYANKNPSPLFKNITGLAARAVLLKIFFTFMTKNCCFG
jgi:hypothetical protein